MSRKNGYIAVGVATPVLVLMALFVPLEPEILAIFTVVIFVAVWIALERKDAKKTKQEESLKKFSKFHEECKKFGIADLKNPGSAEKKQRLELIVKKYGYSLDDPTVVQRFNTLGEQKQQEEKEKKDKAEAEAKQKEQEQYAKLTHYAQLHGTDKPVTMFKDRAKRLTGGSVSFIPMQKGSDGMIMAGIASGIGGTVPALMSLSQTAQSNEAIRQQNQAAHSINMMLAEADLKSRELAQKYQEKADELAVKLIGNMSSVEAFQHLKFENIQTEVSKFGSVTVKAEASVEGKVTVFDKPGFIDGYVIAKIYDGKKKIGEAIMVFPDHGSLKIEVRDSYFRLRALKPVELEGICLECGKPGKEYTVKFAPGDLWVMEQ